MPRRLPMPGTIAGPRAWFQAETEPRFCCAERDRQRDSVTSESGRIVARLIALLALGDETGSRRWTAHARVKPTTGDRRRPPPKCAPVHSRGDRHRLAPAVGRSSGPRPFAADLAPSRWPARAADRRSYARGWEVSIRGARLARHGRRRWWRTRPQHGRVRVAALRTKRRADRYDLTAKRPATRAFSAPISRASAIRKRGWQGGHPARRAAAIARDRTTARARPP